MNPNHPTTHTSAERTAQESLAYWFAHGKFATTVKLEHFPPWLRRQDAARFLARYELFKLILDIPGIVLDCGTFRGSSAFSWLHFSSILEPYNHTRRIISFDTFTGFPAVGDCDGIATMGDFAVSDGTKDELEQLAQVHDNNRPIGHIQKLELVQGILPESMEHWLQSNPSTIVSLLHLDVDLMSPTLGCLKAAWDLIPEGGIIAFDELCCIDYPGETAALRAFMGAKIPKIRRIGLDPYISYIQKGESA